MVADTDASAATSCKVARPLFRFGLGVIRLAQTLELFAQAFEHLITNFRSEQDHFNEFSVFLDFSAQNPAILLRVSRADGVISRFREKTRIRPVPKYDLPRPRSPCGVQAPDALGMVPNHGGILACRWVASQPSGSWPPWAEDFL